MRGRHVSREYAFKLLFELQIRGLEDLNDVIGTIPRQLDDEESQQFCETLVRGCLDKQEELIKTINQQMAHWQASRLAATDRVILLIGFFELIYLNQPPAVVIDESIELAKRYGGENSPSFVNGILDSWNRAQHG